MFGTAFKRCGRGVPLAMFVGLVAAGVALAPPAAAETHVQQYVEVPQCSPATGQECPQIPKVSYTADQTGAVQAQFTANANGCSDALIRFLNDGYPVSDWVRVSPSQTISSGYFNTKAGSHELGVMATGIEGGCNHGVLNAWGGTVRLDSRVSDQPTAADSPACPPWMLPEVCRQFQ